MPTRPTTPKAPRNPSVEVEDRRAPPGSRGAARSLRWVKGALGRPLGLERRGKELHLVLVDRRRKPTVEQPLSVAQLRAELHELLMAQPHGHAARVMRHLTFVHDELGRKGWSGVAALPAQVLAKALVQAEMLASQEPSPALGVIIDRLRVLKVAGDVREERKQQLQKLDKGATLEVSEATHEEFDESERSWVPPAPAMVAQPDPDK